MTQLPTSQGAEAGTRVAETGRLVREAGGFVLQCEHGGKLPLLLPRTPVDEVEKRVALTGILEGDGMLAVETIRLA
ncbi:hypothetical protein KY084_09985 [Stakelama sp. CBK3Z-3]|uniref:Uncharacterized protein n=1 Tax=Stakelama flava TaxID=2860338 RepID=A0ABS6XP44_9SPHN|nr:DUF5818 domain-containing protein [Stakelama flava]MBW4331200.1 hypothetical protein [Stakelama flava]